MANANANAPACSTPTSGNPLADRLRLKLDYEQLTNCMRCGFCLPACPTFRETGVEAESPRGRIALMKAAVDGVMVPDHVFENQMNHCLGCRACEPACPADVKYGQLIEQARDAVEDMTTQHRWWVKVVRNLAFKRVFPHQGRVKLIGLGLSFYQKSGLQTLTRKLGLLKVLPDHLAEMEGILPTASYNGVAEKMGTLVPAVGKPIARVGMFRGCIMDFMFTETNVNTVKLLSEAGFEVVIPKEQGCCGAMHAHSGEGDMARELAKVNVSVFKAAGVDYIVSNAGGCGAILVEYDHLLGHEPGYEEDAAWFASRVKDVSALLVEKGRLEAFPALSAKTAAAGANPISKSILPPGIAASLDAGLSAGLNEHETLITYQDSCHLRNVMRSSNAPRQLMRRIDNVRFIEMKEGDRCCGSAGTYNITQPEMADELLRHKMENANVTEAHYLLTSNPGCLLQMKLGVEKYGDPSKMKAVHIVDFLYERTR